MDTITKNSINSYGSSIANGGFRVDDVRISLSGKGELKSATILNPPRFSKQYFFLSENVKLDFSVMSLFSNTVVINSIKIINPTIQLEIDNIGNTNIEEIIKNVASSKKDTKGIDQPIKANKSTKKFILKELLLQDATLKIVIPTEKKIISIKLAPIFLRNIGANEKGFIPKKIIATIFENLYQQSIKKEVANIQKIKNNLNKIKNVIIDFTSDIKDKLDEKINEKLQKPL